MFNEDSKTGAILVSTGRDFLPHVDAIVAALDRPGKLDENDSAIAGTGLARVAYSPRYRAAADFSNIVNATIGSSTGAAYVNLETNTIFWRDQTTAAKRTLQDGQSHCEYKLVKFGNDVPENCRLISHVAF